MKHARRWSQRWRRYSLSVLLLVAVSGIGLYRIWQSQRALASGARSVPGALTHTGAHSVQGSRHGQPLRVTLGAPASALVSGRVQDEAGGAVSGASVCGAASGGLPAASVECAVSDAAGQFAFGWGDGALLWIYVSHSGYQPLRQQVAQPGATSLVLTLQQGGLAVTGDVIDASGGPITGATLRASDAAGDVLALAVSDAAGRFRLAGAPGMTQVSAQAEGYSEQVRELRPPADAIRLVLVPASSIVGRVLAEATDAPLAAVSVTAVGLDGPDSLPRSALTAEDGSFSLRGLSAGRYSLAARSQQGRSEELRISLGVAELAEGVELTLRAATRILGDVQVEGRPCPRGRVELHGAVSAQALLAGDARVAFDAVLPGLYQAEVNCEGALPVVDAFEVGLTPVTRSWNLARGLQLTGMALTDTGVPLAGAQIDVYPMGEPLDRTNSSCVSDASGEFVCSGLLAGDYDCSITSNVAPRSDSVRVALRPDASARVVLRAHPEGVLRVRVAHAQGYDLSALPLLARQGSQTWLAERRGDEFVFDPLPLGSYQLSLDADAAVASRSMRVALTRAGQEERATLELPAPHTLAGRVVDAEGRALPDVWVRAYGTAPLAALRPLGPALTDAEGAFALPGLLHGRYTLSASSGAGEARLEDVASDAQGVVVRVLRRAALSGSLRSRAGATVRDFVLAYTHLGDGWSGETSASGGTFTLPWLAPGSYRLTAQAPEGTAQQVVDLPAGAELSVALQLGATIPLVQSQ